MAPGNPSSKRIVVIIPARDEERGIGRVLEKIEQTKKQHSLIIETIVVY